MKGEKISNGNIIFGGNCEKTTSIRQWMVKSALIFGEAFTER